MAVYVDDMEASFGRMKMCHMIADTSSELFTMAARIGVQLRWVQQPNTPDEHFDIAKSKRALAVAAGAVPVTMVQLACMVARRRILGSLGDPEAAESWYRDRLRRKRLPASNRAT